MANDAVIWVRSNCYVSRFMDYNSQSLSVKIQLVKIVGNILELFK